ENHPRKIALEDRGCLDLAPHAAQRILRRLVAVEGRNQRRPLHVRVVVRAARGDADPPDAELLEHPQDAARLVQRRVEILVPRHDTETRKRSVVRRLRLPDLIRAAFAIRHGVEHGEANHELEAADLRLYRLHETAHEARASFERTAVSAGAGSSAEQLVTEIAVARLQIDEPESGVARQT